MNGSVLVCLRFLNLVIDDIVKYRPISILPIVSKVFEKVNSVRFIVCLTENSMLSEFQFGFRPKHSTVSALIHMCDEWLENMDNGKLISTGCHCSQAITFE